MSFLSAHGADTAINKSDSQDALDIYAAIKQANAKFTGHTQ